jgi:hypothetical protein
MTDKEIADHINNARAILQRVELQLSDEIHPCATCGFHARENYPEYLLRKRLHEVGRKLQRIAGGSLRK